MIKKPLTILSIDPGYDRVGWAIGQLQPTKAQSYKLQHADCIQTSKTSSIWTRYQEITNQINQLCITHQPDHCAIETIFFSVNKKTAIRVSEARGVIIAALLSKNIQLFEYNPMQIKQTVAGSGTADKESVKKMVCIQMGIKDIALPDDAVDAIAIGITHAVHCQSPVLNQNLVTQNY